MLRGFGDTRFRSPDTLRSGQQGALGQDAIELMDALGIDRAVIGGFDWGGRAACVTAALRPERVVGLVTVGGYNIPNIANSGEPLPPAEESAAWYTHYFLSGRGRRGLERYRDELCELLWRQWSPTWADAPNAFPRSAPSLHNRTSSTW
jgi:pimeloyl-ACP methyl ester carboxylesterase